METIKELQQWCNELSEFEAQKKELKKQMDAIQKEIDEHERVLNAYLSGNSLERFDFGNGLIYRQRQVSVKVTDKELLKKALGAENYEALASINSQILKAYIKQKEQEAFDRGEVEFKVDGVEIKEYYNINLRKS